MKVFVTGTTGFVGQNLVPHLQASGHEVYGLVRNTTKLQESQLELNPIKGSLSCSQRNEWIDNLPDDLDAVIHMAGLVHSFNAHDFDRVNNLATGQLVRDLKERYPRLKFILLSSLAAAGPAQDRPLNETDPGSPVSLYGQSKAKGEEQFIQHAPSAWEKIIIRPPMVIGPKDPAILDIFKMAKGRVILLPGLNGKKKRYSFVCVHDLVQTIALSLENAKEKDGVEIFYSSYPRETSYGQLVEGIAELIHGKSVFYLKMPVSVVAFIANLLQLIHRLTRIDLRLTPDKIHELRADAWLCDSSKSHNMLGMKYQWDLPTTLVETYEDYKKRDWI